MLPKKPTRIIYLLFVLFLIASCGNENSISETELNPITPIPIKKAAPQGDRLLALDVNDLEGTTYDELISIARENGVQVIPLAIFWDDIEQTPGVYTPDPNWLATANQYYSANDLQVALTLSVIDTVSLRVPHDLQNLAFDDPQMIRRFNAFLDYVATQIPDLYLTSLTIGNEIDYFLGNNQQAWTAYETFYQETGHHAREVFSDVPVGTKTTVGSLTAEKATYVQSINQYSDVILLTYYPLDDRFAVQSPGSVHDDFARVVKAYPAKDIYLMEVGYPSGEKNNSSHEKQAAFIHELFLAWDEYAERIKFISYTWMNDPSDVVLRNMEKYYGSSDAGFISCLATLGLRTNQGEDKTAFRQWQKEAAIRGW